MQVGDIILFQGKRWQATTKRSGICVLRAWDKSEAEVPENHERAEDSGLQIVAHPNTWPFLTAPMRMKDGVIVKVVLTREGRTRDLEPLVDWAPCNGARPGGPVFFNPELRLQRGEVLVATYKSGHMTRMVVNAGFASVRRRKQRAQRVVQPATPRTVYDRIMNDDEFEDP